jgi:hypothetical protein
MVTLLAFMHAHTEAYSPSYLLHVLAFVLHDFEVNTLNARVDRVF